MIQSLPTSSLTLRADARAIDDAAVAALAESIATVGLLSPIRVREAGDGYEVIAGAHRLSACRSLGLVEIECDVVTDDDLHAELAMIDENLCRSELSPSDRARQTFRRKELYEALHPEAANGGDRKSDQFANLAIRSDRFTAATAKATGKPERTVQRDAERGEKILPEVLDMIRGTPFDTGTYMDKLKGLPGSEQYTAVKRDLAFLRQRERDDAKRATASKVQSDVKQRAAREVADMIAEYVPGEWWDAMKANLYAAGASNIAHEFVNLVGQSIMDGAHS